MTFTEMCDLFDDPNEAIVAVFQVLRSVEQGEPATDDGCVASYVEFSKQFGPVTWDSVRVFCEPLADVEIPDKLLAWACRYP